MNVQHGTYCAFIAQKGAIIFGIRISSISLTYSNLGFACHFSKKVQNHSTPLERRKTIPDMDLKRQCHEILKVFLCFQTACPVPF